MSVEMSDVDLLMKSANKSASGGGDIYTGWGSRNFSDVEEAQGWVWEKGWHPFVATGVEIKRSKEKQQEYLEVTAAAIGGPRKGKELKIRLMLEGKGRPNFLAFMSAVDLWDRESRQPLGVPADIIDRHFWGDVTTEKREYQGEERERSVVKYAGYAHIDKYELPENADLVDNSDLDTFFEEETPAEEPVPEPEAETQPEPVATAPAPAKPRRVAASGAGSTPPWR